MTTEKLVHKATDKLRKKANKLKFSSPVAFTYNPLVYAKAPHDIYVDRFATDTKKAIFLGMNPGPFGMAQVGIPFGEVEAVKKWLKIEAAVKKPPKEHPKRPITGFSCTRSEVSGRRFWGYFAEKFKTPEKFFKQFYVANYCPLVFMEEGGKNVTPDKLSSSEREALFEICDEHLRQLVTAFNPKWVVGIGLFAMKRAEIALSGLDIQTGTILHPSPASPKANKGWSGFAEKQLQEMKLI